MSQHYLEGLQPDPSLASLIRPRGTPNVVDSDGVPPSRAPAPNPSIFLPYTTEDLAFEEEYEEYLSDLGLSDDYQHTIPETQGTSAWHRLPEYVSEMTDNISDSESIVSIGDLGDANQNKDDSEAVDENLNNWEVSWSSPVLVEIDADVFAAHESEDDGGASQISSDGAKTVKLRQWWTSACYSIWIGRPDCGGRRRGRTGGYPTRAFGAQRR